MKRGSDWIKCDLHIHSPASFDHRYGDRNNPAIWERFLSELESLPQDFKIIGINDYLTLDGYRRILAEKTKGRLANIDCILPVIEFRLNRLVGEGATKRLNYHVIFSDAIDPNTIQTQFLDALSNTYSLKAGSKHKSWSGIISEESLKELGRLIKDQSPSVASLQAQSDWEVGFNNFNIDFKELERILKFTPFEGRILTAIGKDEWDDYRWDGGGAADKRTIINETDIVFLSSESVAHWERSQKALNNGNVNALLLDCSDAHSFSDSGHKDRIGHCYTWIKAEPSFDGLKQILFERQGRISISETNPDKKSPYQVIDYVRFVGGGDMFDNQEIRLSPYLTSIIGGKSTGKSLLAGLIVKAADFGEYQRRSPAKHAGGFVDQLSWLDKELPSMNFEVVWKDDAVTTLKNSETRKVTYFPQHYLNSSINDQGTGSKELNTIIRSVLSQNKNYGDAFDAYRTNIQDLNEEIAASATSFESTLRDLREAKRHSAEKGRSSDIRSNIDKLENQFSELKKSYDLSEEEIALQATLSAELATLQQGKETVSEDLAALTAVDAEALTVAVTPYAVLPDLLDLASEALVDEVTNVVSPLILTFQMAVLEALEPIKIRKTTKLSEIDTGIQKVNTRLRPITEKIAASSPLRELAAVIASENGKLTAALAFEQQVVALSERIQTLADGLSGFVERRLALAGDVMNVMSESPVAQGDEKLKIDIRPHVKSQHVQGLLKDRIKYQSNPDVRSFVQDAEPKDEDIHTYEEIVALVIQQSIDQVLEFKGDHNVTGVLQELLGNAIYLNYDLKLSGDSFSIMSPGKRALALLRVIIELDASEHPIILDQPEDDLDNRSIFEGLATYIKEKKLTRQIIVVTHNPNVVVGGDSEYVVVANQTGQETNRDNEHCQFEYVYAGLECSFLTTDVPWVLHKQGIKEHVCEILDGGRDAFLRREQLYSSLKR